MTEKAESLKDYLRELAEYARKPGDPEAVASTLEAALEEVDALEELSAGFTAWWDATTDRTRAQGMAGMLAARERLERARSQR